MASNFKRHTLQAVELSERSQTAVQIVSNFPAPEMGSRLPKLHHYTTVRADMLHKAGGGLIRDNITLTTTYIHSTINTHNTELQMVKVHINNTKHITIANIYIDIYPRTTKQLTLHTVHHKHTTLSSHRDVNVHSTLWYSYSDHHRGQLIADIISNSDHLTLSTHTSQSAKHHTTTNIITRYHHGV